MRSFVSKVIKTVGSRYSLSVVEQRDSGGTGNNPADHRDLEPELRRELINIDFRTGDDDLVLLSRARGLEGGNTVESRNSG